MTNSRTIYNSIDTYHVTPDYDCKTCFTEHERLIELILSFFNYIHTGLLGDGTVSLNQRFNFYLTKPMEYNIQGVNFDFVTVSSVKAQRIDVIEYYWNSQRDSNIQGIRLWLACHMSNWELHHVFNGQVGREQPIILSAEWLPVQNVQEIVSTASTGVIDLAIPRRGLFAIRLHKIKSKKPLEIIESPYLFNKPEILYKL